jgi:hypothetical protein
MEERIPKLRLVVVRQDLGRGDRLDPQGLQVIGLATGARPWTASLALELMYLPLTQLLACLFLIHSSFIGSSNLLILKE